MRIHILSDLHLEFAPFQRDNVGGDVVVLAGDIHAGMNGIKWIFNTFPDIPVIYVLGNHEFYGQKIPKLTGVGNENQNRTPKHQSLKAPKQTVISGRAEWDEIRSEPI